MLKYKHINPKRLWLLLTSVWFSVVILCNYSSISDGHKHALYAKAAEDNSKKEQEFNSCLEKNGTTKLVLISQYGKECEEEHYKECSGIWCLDLEASLSYNLCIKSKIPECRYIFFATHKPSYFELKKIEWGMFLDEKIFYISSHHSKPLRNSLILIFLVPSLLAASPSLYKYLINWLTVNPKKLPSRKK